MASDRASTAAKSAEREQQVQLGALSPGADLPAVRQWYADQIQGGGAQMQRFEASVRFFKVLGMPLTPDIVK